MAGVTLIDLDTGPAPVREPRGPVRPALLLVLVVLLLAGLAADVPPPPALREVLTAGGTAAAAFELGDGAFYTAMYGANPNSESGVRRFDLRDGSQVWAASLPQGVQNLKVSDGAGVLMARSGTDPRITFLDTATGRALWTSDAANTSASSLARAGVLFNTDVVDATVLRLADPRTGRTIWSRTIDARIYFGPDTLFQGDPRRIVVAGMSGTLTVLDYATGRELSSGDLGGPLKPPAQPDLDGTLIGSVDDNRLVVRRKEGESASMAAYSLVPFARLWERTAGPTGLAGDCGVVWCVSSALSGDPAAGDSSTVGLTAIDPRTGAPLWTEPDLAFAFRFGEGTLLAGDEQQIPAMSLRDPATGRPLRQLGRVVRAGDLLLHADERAPARTWVEVLDERRRPRPLGAIDVGAPFGCEQRGRYLACPTGAGPTKVWRIP